jgi:hypothetical protein
MRLRDLIANLDEALTTIEEHWNDDDELVTMADASVYAALAAAADFLHTLHLEETA